VEASAPPSATPLDDPLDELVPLDEPAPLDDEPELPELDAPELVPLDDPSASVPESELFELPLLLLLQALTTPATARAPRPKTKRNRD
jgi:hypothetical protein